MKRMSVLSRLLAVVSFFCFSLLSAFAQQTEIKGKVVDNEGNDLPGVTVTVKGVGAGTITDARGEYRIKASSNQVLVFSYIGFQSQEKPVGKSKEVNVTLSESLQALDELVVVGYGTVKKRDLLGAVSSVSAKDLERIPVSNAAEAITGKLAGVQVTSSEGAPGADIKIRVRGGGSITQDNSPLYIIDGFPSDLGLQGVDPNDIQSIDVLKDASSTSIYGARGANGVIIITTKGGYEGFNISYNGYAGFRQVSKLLPIQNGIDFVRAQWDRRINAGTVDFSKYPAYGVDMSTQVGLFGEWNELDANYADKSFENWQDAIFGRTAFLHSHNVVIGGGSKNTKYNFNYTHNNENGIMLNSGLTRNYYKFKFDQKLNQYLNFSATASYLDQVTRGAGSTGETGANSFLNNIISYRPVGRKDQATADFANDEEDSSSDDTYDVNPIVMVKNNDRTRSQQSLQMNASLSAKLFKYFTLKLSAGRSSSNTSTDYFYGEKSYYARTNGGISAVIDERQTVKWNTSNTLTFARKWKKHDLNVLLGQEAMQNDYKSKLLTANNFPTADIVFDNLGQAEVQAIASDAYSERLLSFFGRVNYTFNSRYLFSASLRADGSSKFAPKNRFGFFPAVSGAWRISEEGFFDPNSFVSNLKLRYSYGSSGNNRIGNYLYSTNYNIVYYGMGNTPTAGVIPASLANPDLKWETTYTNNLGIDLGVWKNRVNLAAEFYINDTKDLLLDAQIANNSGFTTQMSNVGSTRNIGMEYTINANLISTKDFSWDAGFNISFNKNRIVSLNRSGNWVQDQYTVTSKWGYMSSDYLVKVGQPVGLMYGFVGDGFYTVDDFNDAAVAGRAYTPANLKPGVHYAETQAKESNLLGQMKVKRFSEAVDANGRPVASADKDKVVIGDANPDFFGGFNTSFTYKGFDLSLFFNFVVGNEIYNATKLRGATQYYNNKNILQIEGQRYSLTDPSTGAVMLDRDRINEVNRGATLWTIPTKSETLTDWAIEDGSFLRLNNLSLGYTLPFKWTKKIDIKNLRIYATAYNLFTITKYTGYDPEVDSRNSTPVTPGLDYNAYPRSRQFVFGVNITY